MDLRIVEWFQSLGCGFMDVFFGAFYYLLNPLYTLFIPIILYFLVDKKLGYRTGVFYGVTSFFNGTLKELFNRNRPYVDHPTRVTSRIEEMSSSSSMPSGHAMGSIGLFYPATKQFGYIAKGQRKRIWVFIVAAFVVMMIGFSRPYMGAHYLTDILAGWGFGLAIALALDLAVTKLGDRFYLIGLALIPVMILSICLLPDADSSGVGLAFASTMLIGGLLDHKFIRLDINVRLWKRLVRVAIAALGAFILGIVVVAKIFEAKYGYGLSDLKTEMSASMYPDLIAGNITKDEMSKKIKAVGTTWYFLMFFVANAWAFIVCPVLYKYIPMLLGKIKDKNNKKIANG